MVAKALRVPAVLGSLSSMRHLRALGPICSALLLTGCGYVHFGRLPVSQAGDATLQQAYSDLGLEQKILKQELALARKENETLRAALERGGGAPAVSEAARQLEATARELAALRVSYSKLQGERASTAVQTATSSTLEQENSRLKKELDVSRAENATLADRLKASVAENQQTQAALDQLHQDLRSQQRARERAEQATRALRAQLDAVMARAGQTTPPKSDSAEPASAAQNASPLASLQLAREPASGTAPTFELRTNMARIRAAAAASAGGTEPSIVPETGTAPAIVPVPTPQPPSVATPTPSRSLPTVESASTPARTEVAGPAVSAPTPAPAAKTRTYAVQPGDTLEKIAARFYGSADQWTKIYGANTELLTASQGLKPGMELKVP